MQNYLDYNKADVYILRLVVTIFRFLIISHLLMDK